MKQSLTKKIIGLIVLVLLAGIMMVGCSTKNPNLCKVKECQREHTDGTKYCKVHICEEDECMNVRIGERFCEDHFACALCDNERKGIYWKGFFEKGVLYCEEHACNDEGCDKLKEEGYNYCSNHHCSLEGCYNVAVEYGQFCEEHGCDKCGIRHSGDTKYCDECTCDVPNCFNEYYRSSFCEEHKCKEHDCYDKRYNNEEYCYTHLQEIKEEEKQKQKEEEQIQNQKVVEKDALLINSNGKQLWRVCTIGNEFRFKANYTGTGNFIVTMMDSNQDYYAMICNEIGDYVVDKRIPVYGGEFYYVEIYCSDGSWSGSWSGTYGQ